MHAEKSNFSIARMARLLEVSRSGFYAWLDPGTLARALRAGADRGEDRLVPRRVRRGVRFPTDPGRPARRRGDHLPQDCRHDDAPARPTGDLPQAVAHDHGHRPRRRLPADAVDRVWDTGALNRVWVGDITYLRTWQGWLYLATVIDAHSRRVIGWAIAEHMRADLVQHALRWPSPCAASDPASRVPRRPRHPIRISPNRQVRGRQRHHPLDGTDRGLLGQRDGRIVLRHPENRVLLPPRLAHQTAARLAVGAWIEDRYNRRRRHSALGQISPVQFECNTATTPRQTSSRITPCPPSGVKATVADRRSSML